ncbi:MAG: LysM peptidoglycan-binding domain-containing protein [Bacteroidota bacterium]
MIEMILRKKFIHVFFMLIGLNSVLAQQKGEQVTTANRPDDKIIFNELVNDSLKIILEDYRKTIRLDSVWQAELTQSDLYEKVHENVIAAGNVDKIKLEIPTALLKQRLEKLNAKTPFNIEYNTSLESVISLYLNRDRASTERLINLSYFYFPLFEQVFDQYDIPLEMKYLAVVESALNPRAKSRVGATGIWQFMYPTGKMFDLEVSSYVDERMDPVKSTDAAAQYLKKLHKSFGDWDLALAAYNSGPGNVNKAIRRSGGETNYWEIRRFLPRETAGYVPSFQAIMYLFEYAEEHGFKPEKPQNRYYATDTIRVKSTLKLEQVAELTQLEEEFVRFLNPSYKLGIIPEDKERDYYLRLPYREAGVFVANEAEIYGFAEYLIAKEEKSLPKYFKSSDKITYRVKSGDFLGKIANQFGVRISDVRKWNNLRSDRLSIGQRLTIYPKNANVALTESKEENKEEERKKQREATTYIVKEGDSLWSISRKFPEVSIQEIKQQNSLNSIRIHPGMELKI